MSNKQLTTCEDLGRNQVHLGGHQGHREVGQFNELHGLPGEICLPEDADPVCTIEEAESAKLY